jgi:hypothetical protein
MDVTDAPALDPRQVDPLLLLKQHRWQRRQAYLHAVRAAQTRRTTHKPRDKWRKRAKVRRGANNDTVD